VIDGIIYLARTGIPWRDLPSEFGPWQTVWKRHYRYAKDGTRDKVLAALISYTDSLDLVGWTVSVESTISRAHQHATNTTRIPKGGRIELQGPARRAA
jgi:transposase